MKMKLSLHRTSPDLTALMAAFKKIQQSQTSRTLLQLLEGGAPSEGAFPVLYVWDAVLRQTSQWPAQSVLPTARRCSRCGTLGCRPHFRAAWKGLEEYVKDASVGQGRPILVAHNLQFDLRFVKDELARIGHSLPPWDFADSLRDVAHVVWPGEKGSLSALVERLGLVNEEAHRALCDVEATCDVLRKADEVLAEHLLQENQMLTFDTKPGDFIYNLIVNASEKRQSAVSQLWRDETSYLEASISDSGTEISSQVSLQQSSQSSSTEFANMVDVISEEGACNVTGRSVGKDSDFCDMTSFSHNTSAGRSGLIPFDIQELHADIGHASPSFTSPSDKIQNNGAAWTTRAPFRPMHPTVTFSHLCVRPKESLGSPGCASFQSKKLVENSDENMILARHGRCALTGAFVYFTPSGECYHFRSDCYGLRTAVNIRYAKLPRDGQRPCYKYRKICNERQT